MKNYILADSFKIPKVGFGTDRLKGYDGAHRIEMALNNGYRLLDSAVNYENEGTVGRAIKNSGVPRDQITFSSKLPERHHKYSEALETIEESVLSAGLDYIDLYLIHWPNPEEDKYVEAWQALIDAQKNGLIRSIGVSNFEKNHLERLEKETGVLPVVNQIQLHPYMNQNEWHEYNTSKGIIIQAWSPIGRGVSPLDDEVITTIADKYGKTSVQVILRWEIQRDILPIAMSTHAGRQAENLNIFDFELTETEMSQLNELTQ